MAAKLLIVAAGVLGTTYLSSPYVALYRLGRDLRAGDCAALATDVDWNQVRAGFRAQMAEAAPPPFARAAADELPAFGASFVTHVVNRVIDRVVTPEGLVAVAGAPHADAQQGAVPPVASPKARMALNWGFFDGPRSFVARLHTARHGVIAVRMRLEGTSWRVVRVVLPKRAHRT